MQGAAKSEGRRCGWARRTGCRSIPSTIRTLRGLRYHLSKIPKDLSWVRLKNPSFHSETQYPCAVPRRFYSSEKSQHVAPRRRSPLKAISAGSCAFPCFGIYSRALNLAPKPCAVTSKPFHFFTMMRNFFPDKKHSYPVFQRIHSPPVNSRAPTFGLSFFFVGSKQF